MAWAKNGTPNTLGGTADDITISDMTAYKFNMFMEHTIPSSSTTNWLELDNNANTDYAIRYSTNGGSDGTLTSQVGYQHNYGTGTDTFAIIYGVNIDSEEKLMISNTCDFNAAGAANAPNRIEVVGKCDTTTNSGQYTRADIHNAAAGDFAAGSNLSALGTD
jgi:hypothetical protein